MELPGDSRENFVSQRLLLAPTSVSPSQNIHKADICKLAKNTASA